MPRRFRLPEGVLRRFLLTLGIFIPFVLYVGLRSFSVTRPTILQGEARFVRGATRIGQAVRYVFLEESWEEHALMTCTEEKEKLVQEMSTLRYTDVGPVRAFPVQVVARAYQGDEEDVLVWKQEGDPFVVGEGVGVGRILLGMVVEAKNDLAVVQTITHAQSAIPAMVSGKEETVGIAKGTGGAWLELLYVPKGSAVEVGDTVVTSGLGGGITRGLALGTVKEVIDADPSPFYRIKVEPLIYSDAWWEGEVFHIPSL